MPHANLHAVIERSRHEICPSRTGEIDYLPARCVRTLLVAVICVLLSSLSHADHPLTASPDVSVTLSSTNGDNQNPLKLHLTRKGDGHLLGVFPAHYDQAEPGAEKLTRALWSPKGDFLALAWSAGRRVGLLTVYAILPDSAVEIPLGDYTQNILGRHRTIRQGPHQTDTFVRWVAADELLISTGGVAEDVPDLGSAPYHYHVRLRFHALHIDKPYSELTEVTEVPDKETPK